MSASQPDTPAQPRAGLSFDPVALGDKYIAERDRRLKWNVGVQQYRVMEDGNEALAKDFWAGEKLQRAPVTEACEAVIVGGGFGGLLQAKALLDKGITDFRIIEKGADFGGTWYWNRFPGAQCDIESYIYMPLLDETGYIPTHKYASGDEIREHAQRIGAKFGFYDKTYFQTESKSMRWSEETSSWTIKTDLGDTITSRFVIVAAGTLHRPKFPDLPGLGTFKGHTFHTSRWDYDYTGGDQSGNLTNLADKRVGIIGTGATSVQAVPHLGAAAKQLYVFQRTPSSIGVRGNTSTDAQWAKTLGDKWQRRRVDNFSTILDGSDQPEDLVADGWTAIMRDPEAGMRPPKPAAADESAVPDKQPDVAEIMQQMQLADFKQMEKVRGRCDEVVKDKDTAEKLKPYYNLFCKRPCFHDEYLPTFNRSTVQLIDTNGRGVEAITEKGLIANGQEFELDCIIFATGYDLAGGFTSTSGIAIHGRNGIALSEKWNDGPSTFQGMSTAAFPNLFFISVLQAALFANFHHMILEQSAHIAHILSVCKARDIAALEVSQETEDAWVQGILDKTAMRRVALSSCTPGYYNNEGEATAKSAKASIFGVSTREYMKAIREWREKDSFEGFKVEYSAAPLATH